MSGFNTENYSQIMKVEELSSTEYHPFYSGYVQKVPKNTGLIDGYTQAEKTMIDFFKSIPTEKHDYCYQPGKWSVKEVVQHVIDTERIFMYRCLRLARHDKTPLSGFEQDDYIKPSLANRKTMDDLVEEYAAVRHNSIVFLKSLRDDDLKFIGISDGNKMSARAAAFIVLGHEIWHKEVLEKRYL